MNLLTTALNAYWLEAEDAAEISDMLVTVQKLGKTTVKELADNMGNVIPIASAYSVELDDLCTAYAVLTQNGMQTSDTTTILSKLFTELSDTGSEVSAVLQSETGKSFEELSRDGESLGDVMEILYTAVDGDSTAFANLWSSVETGRGALSIAQIGAEDYNETLEKIQGSVGATTEAYEVMAES